ncbi:MAG TPA: hypothetical protein VH575_13970 [Gemmataceae bacterium]|jgi:hypothetical protein
MRMLVSSAALLAFVVLTVSADAPPASEDKEAPPKEKGDANLPGDFHPYNVTGPQHKGHFHSLISEHGLEPMVLIFHKNVDVGEPLANLLKKLDAAIEKNPNTRLSAFVVFLPADLPDISGSNNENDGNNDKNDDARLELEKKVEQAAADMKLKHVVLCLDNKADVEKFNLRDDDLVTIILCNKLKAVERFALPQDEFTDAAIEKIMVAVANKLGAKRQ